jgi:flavin reductase (DIM6/NTAB) family NADH-FMN oxidoreductase RutF
VAVQSTSTTDAFLDAMAELARGVALVTCSVEGRTWGTTITSLTSVSLDPPTMLIALTTTSRAARAIAADGLFGVVLLAHDQVQLARACATAGADKFVDDEQLDGSPARFECDVVGTTVVGETTVFYGRVRSAWADAGAEAPLLHHRRRYAWLSS